MILSFLLLVIVILKESDGRNIYHDQRGINSIIDNLFQSSEDPDDQFYQDEEELEDNLSIFTRDRRYNSLKCSFHNLCYCRSKVTKNTFCCDCSMGPCFPATSVIYTPDGDLLMQDLKIGHKVLTVDNGKLTYSKVVAFLDRRPSGQSEYLSIETANRQAIRISENHLIFFLSDNSSYPEVRFAGNIKLGNYLIVANRTDQASKSIPVTQITREVLDGAYVPLTEHGTLLVDGILASCYASYDHYWAQAFLSPVRWFPQIFSSDNLQPIGIMPYVSILKSLASFVLPQNLKFSNFRTTEVEILKSDVLFNNELNLVCEK